MGWEETWNPQRKECERRNLGRIVKEIRRRDFEHRDGERDAREGNCVSRERLRMENLQATKITCATFPNYWSHPHSPFIPEPKDLQASKAKIRKISQHHCPTTNSNNACLLLLLFIIKPLKPHSIGGFTSPLRTGNLFPAWYCLHTSPGDSCWPGEPHLL